MNHLAVGARPSKDASKAPSRRAVAKAQTRERLLQAARSLFMERGYEAATIRDISARAGLSTGAVFASFADKADLFNAIMAEDLEKQIAGAEKALSHDASVEQRIVDFMTSGYRFQWPQLALLRAATSLSWSQGLGGPFGHRPVYSTAIDAMRTILDRGVARGEIQTSANIELIAEMLWDCYLSNYRRALFADWELDQVIARLTEQVRVLLAGAGPQLRQRRIAAFTGFSNGRPALRAAAHSRLSA